jgi:hypothetical protein
MFPSGAINTTWAGAAATLADEAAITFIVLPPNSETTKIRTVKICPIFAGRVREATLLQGFFKNIACLDIMPSRDEKNMMFLLTN